MLNNLSGEVSITWEEKSVTKPLPAATTQLAFIVLASVVFTAVVGFVFLGLSIAGLLALIVLSVCGLGALGYFCREYLLGMIFNDENESSQPSDKDISGAGSTSTGAVETTEAKA